jgi:hypothetical protein
LRAVCRATKRNGEPCTTPVQGANGYCWVHDPANATRRKRAASKSGRGKASRDVAGVKSQLQELADRVLSGELNRADGAVVSQILNIKLRALELERKLREAEDFEERVAALEAALEERNARGHGRW